MDEQTVHNLTPLLRGYTMITLNTVRPVSIKAMKYAVRWAFGKDYQWTDLGRAYKQALITTKHGA